MISVIVPVYNLAAYVEAALDSLRAQTLADWEAIVVDDGSTDHSRDVIQAYLDRHQDPRIRLVWPEKNGGVSAARNLGVAESTGQVLAFLDGDDVYLPGFLAAMSRALETSGAGVAHCRAEQWDGAKRVGWYGPYFFDRLRFPQSLRARNFILPGMMACTRQVWDKVGSFDVNPRIQHVEDWDWVLRAVEAGVDFHPVPQELVRWRRHPQSATAQALRQWRRARFLLAKHGKQAWMRSGLRHARVTQLRNLAFAWMGTRPRRAYRLYRTCAKLEPAYLPGHARCLCAWLTLRGHANFLPAPLRFPRGKGGEKA